MRGRVIWVTGPPGSPEPVGTGGWFMALLIRWAINAIGLLVAAGVVRGIVLEGWESTLLTAALFGLVNAFIRPLVMMMSCLLQVLTLGLFTLIVNTGMLALTAWAAGQVGLAFTVDGVKAAFLGALVISLVSFTLTRFSPSPRRGR